MVALEISTEGGRPTIRQEMRALIRRLSRENVLWSAETIHGHLVLLGFDPPCPDTIRKYMVKDSGRNGQVPKLVDLSEKSPASVLGYGLLHGSYSSLSNPVHFCDLESFPSPDRALCCDGASDDGLGDPATAGSD